MKIIILAGGGGTRLFPLSRKCMPKQFLAIDKDKSLLTETIERFLGMVRASDIIVVTNCDYIHHVRTELANLNAEAVNVILEPSSRNTAPAIGLAAAFCVDRLGCDESEMLFVSPSDHIIRPVASFQNMVNKAAIFAAKDYFVTFGIKPIKPETGFGYIEAGEEFEGAYKTKSFKEKPDLETARQYMRDGNFYWNSGMFAFSVGTYKRELGKYCPEIAEQLAKGYDAALAEFEVMPDISIDYAVAEKCTLGVTLPLDLYWNDVGSWDAIYDILTKDNDGNAVKGDCVALDCHDNLIWGQSRLIAGLGLKDTMIVETPDVILVAKKGESQKVKDMVTVLQQRGRKEATEHTTIYFSWGWQSLLGGGNGYRMKKLVIHMNEGLSARMHYHRSVHWVVTRGTAEVCIGEKRLMVHDNESVYIPRTTKYSLHNPGHIPLVLIEVENGDYLEDDDVVICDEDSVGM